MYNIKIDYMRNIFNYFLNFFCLPTSRTAVSQLNTWQMKNFLEKSLEKI